jgi:hypothetical protein
VRVRERVVEIPGEGGAPALVGVLVEPDADDAAPRRGLVLLSSAQERRTGPHRLWVSYARERAARGDVVLRVDIAGIGDSAPHPQPAPPGTPLHYDPRAAGDAVRAVAWLRRERAPASCTLAGLCSGAFVAWHAAREGAAVERIVCINQLVFHWRPGMPLEDQYRPAREIRIAGGLGRAVLSADGWRRLFARPDKLGLVALAIARRLRRRVIAQAPRLARLLDRLAPRPLAAELAAIGGRGVAVALVFSAGEPGLVLLREEAGPLLAAGGPVRVCGIAHADHTFAGASSRRELYATLDELLG